MIRLILFVISLAICNFIYSQNLSIEGKVFDSKTNNPISNATVQIRDSRIDTVTNNNGEFKLLYPDSLINRDIVIYKADYDVFSLPLNILNAPKIEIYLEHRKNTTIEATNKGKVANSLDKALNFVMNDWVALGPKDKNKFDFGRLQTIPTMNPIEGFRLRGGIASNSRLSPNFFVKGYLAYGFKDRKFKYRGEAIYSFIPKDYYDGEFPKNNLRFIYENDIFSPGEIHPRAMNDLLLVTYRRSKNETTYREFFELNYEREYLSGFSNVVWTRKSTLTPQGELMFYTDKDIPYNEFSKLNNFEVGLSLIYNNKPHYKHTNRHRTILDLSSPLFSLSHSVGLKDIMGGDNSYHRTEVSIQKRFSLNEYATIDVVGEYAKVWNRIPFPLLIYPNQRQRFNIENNAFFLSRSLEFVADEQFTLRGVFVGNKLLLNRSPILNKLGIKELLSFRATYGHLSSKNIPSPNNQLFVFPYLSHQYEKGKPYIEGTVGITNILGLLRLEYVHRFNYRNYPEAILGAVRLDITL